MHAMVGDRLRAHSRVVGAHMSPRKAVEASGAARLERTAHTAPHDTGWIPAAVSQTPAAPVADRLSPDPGLKKRTEEAIVW